MATVTFVTTPLLLPSLIDRLDVSTGSASLISAVQLAGFVAATWGAGRFLSAGPRVFIGACAALAACSLASAGVSVFVPFLAIRLVSGVALGLLTWLAWSEAFGNKAKMSDVSTVGPLAAMIGSPLCGVLLAVWNDRAVFVLLAALAVIPLLWVPRFAGATTPEQRGSRNRPVAAAVVLIAALGLLTMGGSATMAYAGVVASDEIGMGAMTLSLIFAANAAAGIPSARWKRARRYSGAWVAAVGACAAATAATSSAWMFAAAVTVWGFVFWAGVPGVFDLLAARSRHPAERAGDAQAVMAAGRVAGPLLGGVIVGSGSFATLGVVSALLLCAAGAAALVVEFRPTAVVSVDS